MLNMGHNGLGINMYGVLMIPMGNLHSDRGTLSLNTPALIQNRGTLSHYRYNRLRGPLERLSGLQC